MQRDDANARFYGSKVSVSDIFEGKVKAPPAAMPLLQTLYAAEGRPEVLGTQHIPQGLTPGDTEITPEEARVMEAHNHDEKADHTQTQDTQATPISQQSVAAEHAVPPTSSSSIHRVPPPPPPPTYESSTSSYPPEKN